MKQSLSGRLAARPTTFTLSEFFRRVWVDEKGCWHWCGAINYKGYGVYVTTSAHRFTYSWFVGPIPPGYEIDHLCRVRDCVNPAHLEAVTTRENHRRSHYWANFGVCKRGHQLTTANTYTWLLHGVQQRCCRKCRMASRSRWLNKRAVQTGWTRRLEAAS